MGNSVAFLAFSCHDLMHGTVARNRRFISVISLLYQLYVNLHLIVGWVESNETQQNPAVVGFHAVLPNLHSVHLYRELVLGQTLLWMPPTLWKILHNWVHHITTNSLSDPDRNYLSTQPKTWGKWLQNVCFPSFEVHPIGLIIGVATAWGFYTFRNLTSVLLFNRKTVAYLPAAFEVKLKERWAIAGESLIILVLHLGIFSYLRFNPLKLVLSYFLLLWIGYSIMIFYIYTHHLLCPMTEINDPSGRVMPQFLAP